MTMERPRGPLPPIPPMPEHSPVAKLEGMAKSLEDDVITNNNMTPMNATIPTVQPNSTTTTTTTVGTVEERKVPSKQPSIASSTESVKAGGVVGEEVNFSMNHADYSIGAAIGFGSSAIVHYALYVPVGVPVAVKMIDLDHFERNQIDELRREIQVMTLCRHPNLLRVLASFVNLSKLWIVTPYLSGGSCLDIMKTGFRDGFEEAVIATILQQALKGLEYLHRNGHIHRDFKAGNLLMDEVGGVQLADFGVSSCLTEDSDRRGVRKTFVGTPCWMAPEVMEMSSKGYDSKADIWSFGITALELAYGHAPFSKYPPMKVIYMTLSSAPPTLDRQRSKYKYSKTFKEMIEACLQKDPARRPTAESLLKHSFFRAAKKQSYLVSEVLQKIPPLGERPRVKRLIKQITDANDQSKKEEQEEREREDGKEIEEWDFSTSASDGETDASTTVPPVITSNGGTITRSSRFVVEAEGGSSSSSALTSAADGEAKVDASTPLGDTATDVQAEEEESTVKKGRFSVLESATTGEASTSPSSEQQQQQPQSKGQSPPPPEECEEGRRSRFQVETSSNQAQNNVRGSPLTVAAAAQSSRFEISTHPTAAIGIGRESSSPVADFYHHHHPEQHHHPSDQHSTNAAVLAAEAPRSMPPLPNLRPPGEGDFYGSSEYYGVGRSQAHIGSMIFVHPSQIDQLLLLNELIRQQLIELRNSPPSAAAVTGMNDFSNRNYPYNRLTRVGYGGGTSASFHPTVHAATSNNFGRVGSSAYWATGEFEERPGEQMMEDPMVSHPPHPSSYSPHPSYLGDSHLTSVGGEGYLKRRSFSIDHRQLASPSSYALPRPQQQQQHYGTLYHHNGASNANSHIHHRSVHSLKSPFYNSSTYQASSSAQPDQDTVTAASGDVVESLRRQLELLQRENEQLRKRPPQ